MFPDGAACGWAAGVFCTVGYSLYFWRLKTSPNFNPQGKDLLVWALVSSISALGYGESGAKSSLLTPVLDAGWPLVIAVICLKKNPKLDFGKADAGIVTASTLGLAVWQVFGTPLACLVVCVLLDWYATAGIVKNAYRDPLEEPFWSWAFTTLACFLNLGAALAESTGWELLVYPLSCLMIACLVLIVVWCRLLLKGFAGFLTDLAQRHTTSKAGQERLFQGICPAFASVWLPQWAASGDI